MDLNLENIANVATILSFFTGVAIVSVPFGLLPRAGPGRAVTLALHSFLRRLPQPRSTRTSDVAELRNRLSCISRDRYIVVLGPKGVGKTCAISRALERTCGVVIVEVSPKTSKDTIVRAGLEAVAGRLPVFLDPRPSALRVLWWYSLLPLPPPIVLLRLSERSGDAACAETAGAVRALVACGLRAVIDSSPNSLEPEVLTTLREDVLELAPMPRQQLFSIPEHSPLFALLKREGLEDVVWAVLGGVPALYVALRDALKAGEGRGEHRDDRGEVSTFIRGKLLEAITRLRKFNPHPSLEPMLIQFRTLDEIPAEAFKGVSLPSPNKVLREVNKGVTGTVYVPADAAMALVLRHHFQTTPTLEALQALCASPTASPKMRCLA